MNTAQKICYQHVRYWRRKKHVARTLGSAAKHAKHKKNMTTSLTAAGMLGKKGGLVLPQPRSKATDILTIKKKEIVGLFFDMVAKKNWFTSEAGGRVAELPTEKKNNSSG